MCDPGRPSSGAQQTLQRILLACLLGAVIGCPAGGLGLLAWVIFRDRFFLVSVGFGFMGVLYTPLVGGVAGSLLGGITGGMLAALRPRDRAKCRAPQTCPWIMLGRPYSPFSVIVLLGLFVAVLGSVYLSRLQRGVLALCIIWLLAEPFIVWAPEKALMRDAARIHIGMTVAEAEASMAGYSGGTSLSVRMASGISHIVLTMCDTTAHFDFAGGRVVRVWVDTD